MKWQYLFFILLVVGIFFLLLAGYYALQLVHLPQPALPAQSAIAVENQVTELHLNPRAKENGCAINGPLPDLACTPGAVFASATPEIICVSGYTTTVRNVSVTLKRQVYAEYGLSYPQASGAYEADHLIPLELGGSNDIANLFPEAANPPPGFHEKDLVENYLHNQVCEGKVSLAAAQQQIATDWVHVYQALTPSELEFLYNQLRQFAH
jgi:hypothetical protein